MNNLIIWGRIFYGLGIAALGLQQFQYSSIRPVISPEWPHWLQYPVFAYLLGILFIVSGILIIIGKMAKQASMFLGTVLLLFFLIFHVPNQLFIIPYSFHFGLWTDALKELALSGGAFITAVSYSSAWNNSSMTMTYSNKLFLAGKIFFAITMIVFGIDHFIYTDFVAGLVPLWIPGHIFWTYFAGVALAGSGIAIVFNFKIVTISLLLATMLFIWFIILHIPRAVADPGGQKGNEVTSVFEALAFSGIALQIAYITINRNKVNRVIKLPGEE